MNVCDIDPHGNIALAVIVTSICFSVAAVKIARIIKGKPQ